MTHGDLVDAARAAASGGAWCDVAHHDPRERTFALLHRDAEHEVWVVCWMPGHDTGFHDHDGSAASIVVVAGEIVEERLGLSGAASARYAAGDAVAVPAAAIHRIRHVGTEPATTIHVYSPPLRRLGRYAVAAGGVLERHAAPAGEALAPLAANVPR